MSNKPLIKVSGKVQDLKKVIKNEKPKQTNFLLTINSNQQYKDDDKHLDDDIEIFNNSININEINKY